ncbi:4-hydroxyphenylacetate 3-hydroxylase family protein [Streptomyces sp. NPDC058045]|uniref:4-hydroxyphenylacetate 3-hydroxylase family protein n=1 Tax=Streptomyces sp. NPDC058045 TaxID=3346311 RepID=UPI0036E309F6
MRTGNEYLASLQDGRAVYVDGERVKDVTSHPAFAPVAQSIAGLYDLAADPANGLIYTAPETGSEANIIFSVPRSREDLTWRREAIVKWARRNHGWIGRGPDHFISFIAAFGSHPEAFTREPRDFGANAVELYRRMLDQSLYVTNALIPPQVSRATTAHGWDGDFIQVGVVAENSEGIVVRGAQMLATGATVSDEIFVSCIKPLSPEDRVFANSFSLPLSTEGLKLYCRRPYAPGATSHYDYPLSSRFDETDALLVFDDVLVPWERVLVDRDVAGLRKQFFETGGHVLGNWQAQIRFTVKLQFLVGLARKVTAVNGVDRFPAVQEKLGELASIASLVESAVLASEYGATPDANGMWRPDARALYGAMGLQAELYPRVIAILRELAGGGVLQLPAGVADMRNPESRADFDRYVQSPGVEAEERVKLFKLVWDVVGSEFGGRHQQYEMFYAGAPFVAKGYAFRNYGFDRHLADVEEFLAGYGIDGEA